jgi:hypothetical protein
VYGDIKQAAGSVRIESAGDGFEGSGPPPKAGSDDGMKR